MASLLAAQEVELQGMTDLFGKLMDTCQKKCVSPQYYSDELSKGESVCIDRCTVKFLAVHEQVGEIMQDQQQKQMAAMQQQQ